MTSRPLVARLTACLALSLTACTEPSSSPVDGGPSGRDASAPDAASATAEAEIGPAGGTLTLGALTLEIPANAVATPTVFRIVEERRAPVLPASTSAVSGLYRIEPATTFAEPVEISVAVDASRVGARTRATDGLLLMRAPTGTDDFAPIGAAALDAAIVVGRTSELSVFVATVFRLAMCDVPDPSDCASELTTGPGAAAGHCTISTAAGDYTARCEVSVALDRVECSCSSDVPGATPVQTGPLRLSGLIGAPAALAAHTFLSRCGWPCSGGAPVDAGTPDTGTPDTG
ncbi:hypothetical protein L6R52_39015, partial [Myxococcota bacterium]|nr:hypothetical protein [Myxococcota bacterium]